MDILETLREDHRSLRSAMDRLADGTADPEQLRRFATDLLAHARDEDELLFVALEEGLPADHGPLAVMRHEHAAIDAGLVALAESPGPVPGPAGLTALLDLARGHFLKEEQVLFPFAERLFDRERLQRLGAELAARRSTA